MTGPRTGDRFFFMFYLIHQPSDIVSLYHLCYIIRDINEIGSDTVTSIDIPHSEVASFISLQTDLDTVHLFGNQKFAKKIQEDCLKKYNVKNVTFSINS